MALVVFTNENTRDKLEINDSHFASDNNEKWKLLKIYNVYYYLRLIYEFLVTFSRDVISQRRKQKTGA